ncbi:inorganic pyrophosphatase [Nitzschia inconspicua]|uniref:Inorganic pyrophosphatase n=1 Tax=Nitzschia inconspicua TaxID=303405 RepID=A0A9K3LMU5_9STRA|nr:inorganic pyrophosphatase [Nitzschia inconspicua]
MFVTIRPITVLVVTAVVVASEAASSFRGQLDYRQEDDVHNKGRKQHQLRDLRVRQAITTSEVDEEFTAGWRVFFEERNVGEVSPWHKVFLNAPTKGLYNMIVEIPKNTIAKNEMNKWEAYNPIWQDRRGDALRDYIQPMYWNYGYFPRTYESPWEEQQVCDDRAIGDDDPVDVLEISGAVFGIGDIIEVKLLGALPNVDIDKNPPESDWKLLAVAKGTPQFDEWNDIDDVPDYIKSGIREWFRWRSYGNGEDELQYYACDEAYQNAEKSRAVVQETYEYWKKLVSGEYDDLIAMEDPEEQVWYETPPDLHP